MAKYSRLKVLTSMIEVGMVPVFYHSDPQAAIRVIEACLEGGVRCFEFTNRGDGAHEVFREVALSFQKDDRLILGAGSVLDPATAALYIQLGANFIVGPVLNAEVARVCNRRKVAYSPGCGTLSEISQAEELGVEICKIFPERNHFPYEFMSHNNRRLIEFNLIICYITPTNPAIFCPNDEPIIG